MGFAPDSRTVHLIWFGNPGLGQNPYRLDHVPQWVFLKDTSKYELIRLREDMEIIIIVL